MFAMIALGIAEIALPVMMLAVFAALAFDALRAETVRKVEQKGVNDSKSRSGHRHYRLTSLQEAYNFGYNK